MTDPLYPYQYELVWKLMRFSPQMAVQLGGSRMTAQGMATSLRPLVKRGWVTVDRSGPVAVYSASERAREAVGW